MTETTIEEKRTICANCFHPYHNDICHWREAVIPQSAFEWPEVEECGCEEFEPLEQFESMKKTAY